MRLTGELNALVTGASSGIGKAIAVAIAETGASVCIVGRDHSRLKAVAKAAQNTARFVVPLQADLTIDADILSIKTRLKSAFDGLDILVHCAGTFATGSVECTPVEEFDKLYKLNVRAPYALTRSLLPLLIRRQGQIVFVNSSQGLEARENCGAYASTKHALTALADSLRQELNTKGIRILSIYPGRTATPMMEKLYKRSGILYRPEQLLQPESVAQAVIDTLRMPPTAEITNIEIRPSKKSY